MKIFEADHVFDYPWDHVSRAHWRKYPNEAASHVIAIDTLRNEVTEDGRLLIERIIAVKQGAPSWVQKLLGASTVSYVREVSEVDPHNKSLTLRSTNLTFNCLLQVNETVKYIPHPADPEKKTLFSQDAQIMAKMAFRKISNLVEDFSVERFGQNAKKGKEGFESVLAQISSTVFREESSTS